MINNKKGNAVLTVLAIIVVLTMLFYATYLINKSYQTEKKLEVGKILCTQLMNAAITYYREHGKYLVNDKVFINEDYPFDARTNMYFSIFSTYPAGGNKQAISVFGSGEMLKYELRVVFDKDTEPQSLRKIKIQTLTKEY